MKITIELELQAEEIPAATKFVEALKKLTSQLPVTVANTQQLFRELLMSCVEPSPNYDQIAQHIQQVFDTDPGAEETKLSEFFNVLGEIVFPNPPNNAQRSVIPYLTILPSLSEGLRTKIRDRLIPSVLKFLTIKRPKDCNRFEFFAYAEAFAALVKFGCVSVTGAATTITTLLQEDDTRCAALTTLGKTVELCKELLTDKCDTNHLNNLRRALDLISDTSFSYDVKYIKENMSWNTPVDPVPRQPFSTPPSYTALKKVDTWERHEATIFAVQYDVKRRNVISAGKDGSVIIWSTDGTCKNQLTIPGRYACSLDISHTLGSIVLCGVPRQQNVCPAIVGYRINEATNRWHIWGQIEGEKNKLFSVVKVLGTSQGNSTFVVGESRRGIEEGILRLYDPSRAMTFGQAKNFRSYSEHTKIVTAIAEYPNAENLFFSGSQDCQLKLWDTRQKNSSSTFTSYHKLRPAQTAHEQMITCLSTHDNLLVSGGIDKVVNVWDLRAPSTKISQIKVDDTAVMKVAVGPKNDQAIISTCMGLYLTDTTNAKPVLCNVDNPKMVYNDLQFGPSFQMLYAGGEKRIDVFKVV